jgi:hypothetical protein
MHEMSDMRAAWSSSLELLATDCINSSKFEVHFKFSKRLYDMVVF